jgi:hypothetical protein
VFKHCNRKAANQGGEDVESVIEPLQTLENEQCPRVDVFVHYTHANCQLDRVYNREKLEKPETNISNVSILSSSKKGCRIRHNIVRVPAVIKSFSGDTPLCRS